MRLMIEWIDIHNYILVKKYITYACCCRCDLVTQVVNDVTKYQTRL